MKYRNLISIALLILFCERNCFAQTVLTLQPGQNGKDASVDSNLPNSNNANAIDFLSATWTCAGDLCLDRGLIEFDLSLIPAGATIMSAYLSFYANNNSVFGYPGSPTFGSNNSGWLKRITSSWKEDSVTWNNQPSTTSLNQTIIPQSTSDNQDYINIDVKKLVYDMLAYGNYGFMLMQKNEVSYYNSLIFCSGDYPDSTRHPKLVITYIECAATLGTITALRDTICSGTPANLTVTGHSDSIQWQSSLSTSNFKNLNGETSTSFTGLPNQTTYYRVVFYNGLCSDTSTPYKITVRPSPVAGFAWTGKDLTFDFNTVGSSGDITQWVWDFGDGSYSNKPNPSHSFALKDIFHICLTVYNGSNCSFTLCRDIDLLTGVQPVSSNGYSVFLYPNPAANYTDINVSGSVKEEYELIVTNMYGQRVKYLRGKTGTPARMETTDLPSGIYVYEVRTEGVTVTQGKFAVE